MKKYYVVLMDRGEQKFITITDSNKFDNVLYEFYAENYSAALRKIIFQKDENGNSQML